MPCCPLCLAVVHPNRDKNRDSRFPLDPLKSHRPKTASRSPAKAKGQRRTREALPAPPVPPPSDLIREWQVCPVFATHRKGFCTSCEQRQQTYRLLVDWLQDDKFLGARISALPMHLQAFALNDPPSVPAKMVPLLPKRYQSAARSQEFLQLLVLAWCIRQAEHERFAAMPKASRVLRELSDYGADTTTLLDLTYLPEEILEIVPAMRGIAAEERQRQRLDVLSYRKNIAQGREAELQEEIPPEADQEARWASQFGIDKQTDESSRQVVWTLLFVPLTLYLRRFIVGRKLDSWRNSKPIVSDKIFKTASSLVHLRYPCLWSDRWTLVKKRSYPFLQS